MSKTFQNISGTFDILPEAFTSDGTVVESSASWHYVEERIREVMAQYRFHEIRTPVFEPTELIARGVGELTDIVSKEMFAFERGDTNYVLRPELTAPAIRAYLQHHLEQKGGVQKLFYMGPCFRSEKPQKGRYRQFHQFGVEVIGASDARADVETVAVLMQIYTSFGLKDLVLKVNTLGDEQSRPAYKAALQEYFEPLTSELSETSRKRLKTNPLRILDTKIEEEQELVKGAPRLLEFIDDASREHYEAVKGHLSELEIPFTEDPFLVRGLDYYTRTAYELDSPHLGAQSTLAGGGRYDLLAQELGSSEAIPAVGFAAGFERLFLALAGEGVSLPDAATTGVYIVALGDAAEKWAFKTANQWRTSGLRVAFDLQGRSMKAQMRDANRHGASKVVIVGENELTSGKAIVREMETGDQQSVPLDDLSEFVL
ncbi:MAG: histidine--tRNA ligase [Rhodothermia bacterium]|nr:MAG: histidine--tRNA ligase [Rhodothermia bacterium]